MKLDLCRFFGLLHWICSIQIVHTGRGFLRDTILSSYFIYRHTLPYREQIEMIVLLQESNNMASPHQGDESQSSEIDGRFVKCLLSSKLSRRKRSVPDSSNVTKRPGPRTGSNNNNTQKGATAYAFGNPSLPTKPKKRKRKPPKPIPPG